MVLGKQKSLGLMHKCFTIENENTLGCEFHNKRTHVV